MRFAIAQSGRHRYTIPHAQASRQVMKLLGFIIKYDSDWHVQLYSPNSSDIEYGIIRRNRELVSSDYQNKSPSIHVAFVVPNVDLRYKKAIDMDISIIQKPRNEFYGQRRFLTQDPNGCLVDVCSPCGSE